MCRFEDNWVRVNETYDNIESVCSIGSRQECDRLRDKDYERSSDNINMDIVWEYTHNDIDASNIVLDDMQYTESTNYICLRVSESSITSRILSDDSGTCNRIGTQNNVNIQVVYDIPTCRYIELESCELTSIYQTTKTADGVSIRECADTCYTNTSCDFFKWDASSCWAISTLPHIDLEIPIVGHNCMPVAPQSSPTVYIPRYARDANRHHYQSLELEYYGLQCEHTGRIVSETNLNPLCSVEMYRHQQSYSCVFECAGYYENEEYDFMTIRRPFGLGDNNITCEIHAYSNTTLECGPDWGETSTSITYERVKKCIMDGHYISEDGQCQQCPVNTYNSLSGYEENFREYTGIDACICISGYMGSVRDGCVMCAENHYSNGGNTNCTKCPHGSTSIPGSKSLDDCTCTHGQTDTSTVIHSDGICMNVLQKLIFERKIKCWAGGEWMDLMPNGRVNDQCDIVDEANCSMSTVVTKSNTLLQVTITDNGLNVCLALKDVRDFVSIASGEHPNNDISCSLMQHTYESISTENGHEEIHYIYTVMRRWYGCRTLCTGWTASVVAAAQAALQKDEQTRVETDTNALQLFVGHQVHVTTTLDAQCLALVKSASKALVASSAGTVQTPGLSTVVKLVIDVPLTVVEFTEDKQTSFTKSIAATAGVAKEFVEITEITEINSIVRRRRILSASISVATKITVQNTANANAVSGKMTPDNINRQMTSNGMPAVTVSVGATVETVAITTIASTPSPTPILCTGWPASVVSAAQAALQKDEQTRVETDTSALQLFIGHQVHVTTTLDAQCLALVESAKKALLTSSAGRCVVGLVVPVLVLSLHLASPL